MNIKIACNIIIYSRGYILLGKRASAVFNDMWSLPGGHANFRESIYRCAKRELFEETGFSRVSLNLFFIIEEIKKTEHYYHFFFGVILKKDRPRVKNKEFDRFKEWRYFKINNFPKTIIPSHRHAINNFIKICRKYHRFENFVSNKNIRNQSFFEGIYY